MTPDTKHSAIIQTVAATPSVGFIAAYLNDIPMSTWTALGGLCLIVLQFVVTFWRWRRDVRHEEERRLRGLPPPPTDRGGL